MARPSFSVRLVAYDLAGTRVGAVPAPLELTWYDKINDVSTLEAKWDDNVPNHRRLKAPCYIALEYRGDDNYGSPGWYEGRDSRFWTAEHEWDRKDITSAQSVKGRGLLDLLDHATVGNSKLGTDGKRHFTSMTPGNIVLTLLNEYQARDGANKLITAGFTANWGTGGKSWSQNITRAYDPATTLKAVIMDLVDANLVDVWTQGWTLNLSAPNAGGTNRTNDSNTVWIRDSMITQSPEKESWANLADSFTLISDGGYVRKQDATNPYRPFGRSEKVLSVSGVSDSAAADAAIAGAIADGAAAAQTFTRQWTYVDNSATPYMPLRDFANTDLVFVDSVAGHRQALRVQDMKITLKNDGTIEAFMSVGTVRDNLLAKTAKGQRAITNNAYVSPVGPAMPNPNIGNGAITTDPNTGTAAIDWSKTNMPPATPIDTTPTEGSTNPVTSQGIKGYVDAAIASLPPGMTKELVKQALIGSRWDWTVAAPGDVYCRRTLSGWSGDNALFDYEIEKASDFNYRNGDTFYVACPKYAKLVYTNAKDTKDPGPDDFAVQIQLDGNTGPINGVIYYMGDLTDGWDATITFSNASAVVQPEDGHMNPLNLLACHRMELTSVVRGVQTGDQVTASPGTFLFRARGVPF